MPTPQSPSSPSKPETDETPPSEKSEGSGVEVSSVFAAYGPAAWNDLRKRWHILDKHTQDQLDQIKVGAEYFVSGGGRATLTEWQNLSFLDQGALSEAYMEVEGRIIAEVARAIMKKLER